jgi:hypothetical protein
LWCRHRLKHCVRAFRRIGVAVIGDGAVQLFVLEAAAEVGVLLAELKGPVRRVEASRQKTRERRGWRPNHHPAELQPILPPRVIGIGHRLKHPKPHVEAFPASDPRCSRYCRARARLMTIRWTSDVPS